MLYEVITNATQNALIVRAVLGGEPGPKRDVVLLNAGFALVAAGLSASVPAGIRITSYNVCYTKLLRHHADQPWCNGKNQILPG